MKRLFTIALCISLSIGAKAQNKDVLEQMAVHLNADLLLAGETLHYAAYCTSAATGKPSSLSSVAYVELIGADQKPVFQHRIKLLEGQGQGDFFISSLVPTGTYQLVAYTRWMRNFESYTSTAVTIVNPFEAYEPPAKELEREIQWYPEGGALVAGEENNLGYQIPKSMIGSKGRIVDGSGKTLVSINFNAAWGGVSFQLNDPSSLQLIAESQDGALSFHSLPAVQYRAALQLKQIVAGYQIKVVGALQSSAFLRVSDGQNTVMEQEVAAGNTYTLLKKGLKSGLYRAALMDPSDQVISERIFAVLESPKADVLPDLQASTRDLVAFPLELPPGAKVSVSVRQLEAYESPEPITDQMVFKNISNKRALGLTCAMSSAQLDVRLLASEWKEAAVEKTVQYLPESRGPLVAGKMLDANGEPLRDTPVTFSLVGRAYQLQAGKTSETGAFTLQLDPTQGDQQAFVAAPFQSSAVQFEMEEPFLSTYPAFDYRMPILDSALAARLAARSVHNQIANAYYEVWQDSILQHTWQPQLDEFDYFYLMDDYNRFKEMHEHFIEYIPVVAARKNENRSKMKVFLNHQLRAEYPTLLLFDGVPVSAEEILDVNPYKVESIGVMNNRFFWGGLVADGLVAFHSFEGNLAGFRPGANTHAFTYQGLEAPKVQRFPDYANELAKRTPDYRQQLYWNPSVTVSESSMISFYTADVSGTYIVRVEGVGPKGQVIQMQGKLEVVAPLDQ